MARQLSRDGQAESGLRALQELAALRPDDEEPLAAQGQWLLEQKRAEEAAEAFKAAWARRETAAAARGWAEALAALGRTDQAQDKLQIAIERGDKSPGAYLLLAELADARGQTEAASQARRQAVLATLADANVPELAEGEEPVGSQREAFVEHLAENLPYPGFDPAQFWELVAGSFTLPRPEKLQILEAASSGGLPPEKLRELGLIFEVERKHWRGIWGSGALPAAARVAAALSDTSANAFEDLAASEADQSARAVLLAMAGGIRMSRLDSKSLKQACADFSKATQCDAEIHFAWRQWAAALGQLASEPECESRRALLERACECYEEAGRIQPDSHEALYFWGVTLGRLADEHDGEARITLLKQACTRYEEAVRIKSDADSVFQDWAIALLKLAQSAASRQEARPFANDAAARCRQANAIRPHVADYNLACALVWLGEIDDAWQLLQALQADWMRGSEAARREHLDWMLKDLDLLPLWQAQPDWRAEVERARDQLVV